MTVKTDSGAKITSFLFLGFLLVLSAASLLWPQKGFSESENRYLKKKPEFTVKSLVDGSYGEAYEAYLGDQFPLRDRWVGLKVRAEQAQLKKDVNGVYLSKDHYLIEKFDREDLEGEQLTKNLNALAVSADRFAGKLGEDHVKIMLVPSASQILTDKLPAFAAPYDQKQVTDRLLANLAQLGRKQELLISAEQALKERSQEPVYYRTDHHWTADGAYYGYRAWAQAAGVTAWEREEFEEKTVTEEFLGTVYSKINISSRPDSIKLFLPRSEQQYQVYYDGLPEEHDSLYDMDALKGKDKYSVYLNGNHGLTKIVNGSAGEAEKGKKLMIIKDSFAHSFAPFAANHYEEVYMVDLRYFNLNPERFAEETGITDLLYLYQIPGFAKEASVGKLLWQG